MNHQKKSHKRGLQKLFNRRTLILLLLLAQILFTVVLLYRAILLKALLRAFSIVTALHLMTRNDKSAFKLSLIFLILLFPLFGGAFYWIFHSQTATVGFRMRLSKIEKASKDAFCGSHEVLNDALCELPAQRKLLHYFERNTDFPVYDQTQTAYLGDGQEMLNALLSDIKAAERYIFLEYFIIEDGIMWQSILEVLKSRVAEGVDVRILYDDVGCFFTLPVTYERELSEMGIRCAKFNRFHPFLTTLQNNRDHRKIAVIDGKIAYTGGINLADEYIGKRIRFGTWKDSAVRLCGDGAWSFAVMFLQTWSFLSKKEEDFDAYRPFSDVTKDRALIADGWVQPYSDSPMGKENVGEQVYLRIIEQAQRYLYITTPYLMIDDGMLSALQSAAKSGVDVRIITPEIPDKPTVHFTTRSYYQALIDAGVKIYEFKGGFIHAKSFVSDDTVATVGTVNLDFRSLYLHFECGVCLYRTSSVKDVKEDFLKTQALSRPITAKDCKANLLTRLCRNVCRVFAPLM